MTPILYVLLIAFNASSRYILACALMRQIGLPNGETFSGIQRSILGTRSSLFHIYLLLQLQPYINESTVA